MTIESYANSFTYFNLSGEKVTVYSPEWIQDRRGGFSQYKIGDRLIWTWEDSVDYDVFEVEMNPAMLFD